MPTYFVKTVAQFHPENEDYFSRTLIIEADSFEHTDGNYEFLKSGGNKKARVLVASVPSRNVFAVAEDDSYKADHLFFPSDYDDLEDDDDFDDLCDECREAMNAEDTAPEAVQPVPVPETPTAVPDARDESYPIEKWRTINGEEYYGFQTNKGFVHTNGLEGAKMCRQTHRNNPSTFWIYKDLTGATKLEENL